MVEVAAAGVEGAAGEHAVLVTGRQRSALGSAELLGGGVGVEELGAAVEQRRQQRGVAQQPVGGSAGEVPTLAPQDEAVEVVDLS